MVGASTATGELQWWSDSASVWVDAAGAPHLQLRQQSTLNPTHYTDRSFKLGSFVWKIEGPTNALTGVLASNVVLGLFAYTSLDFNNETPRSRAGVTRNGPISITRCTRAWQIYANLVGPPSRRIIRRPMRGICRGITSRTCFRGSRARCDFPASVATAHRAWPGTHQLHPLVACIVHMNLWTDHGEALNKLHLLPIRRRGLPIAKPRFV